MRTNDTPTILFAGIDHQSFDTRNFEPTREDINNICRFFSIGELQDFQKNKDVTVSHSNFFIFVATSRGQYALKFYPEDTTKMITIEYAVNRFLTGRHFPTPMMHNNHNGHLFMASNDRLATCFSYMKGRQAWQQIKQQNTISQINTTLLSLKHLLSTAKTRVPFLKQESFAAAANSLSRSSREIAPYDKKNLIDASLKNACQSFQRHQPLFARQCLHNNANLTNILIDKDRVYILDLSHIREDYVLSDLTSLVISCLFLEIPTTTIKAAVQDYFYQHKMESEYLPVLAVLVKIGLIKEYLKNIRREKSIDLAAYPRNIVNPYLFHLSARKESITNVLRKMSDTSTFII